MSEITLRPVNFTRSTYYKNRPNIKPSLIEKDQINPYQGSHCKMKLSNGAYGRSPLGNKCKYNPNFGFVDVIIEMLIALGMCIALTAAVAGLISLTVYIVDNIDEANRKKAAKKLEEAQNKEIVKLSNSLGISFEKAKKIHDQYLSIGMIEPTNDGNEKGLNAVMGYPSEKYELFMDVIVPVVAAQKNQQIRSRNTNIPNGLLLYGPPGTGKTYIAQQLGEHLKQFGSTVTDVNLDVTDHEGNANKIRDAFSNAEKRFKETGKYTIINFVKDMDNAFLDLRESRKSIEEVSALMEYSENCAQKGAIWIGTANNPEMIHSAILRPGRTDKIIPIAEMEKFAVADMLKYSLIKHGFKNSTESFDYQSVVDTMKQEDIIFTPKELDKIMLNTKAKLLGQNGIISARMILEEMRSYQTSRLKKVQERDIKNFLDSKGYIDRQEYLKDAQDNEG